MPRSIKNHLSNQHPNLDRFGSQLCHFGEQRWGQDGAKFAPNRFKNGLPHPSKHWSHFGSLLGRILNNLGLQLGPQDSLMNRFAVGFADQDRFLAALMPNKPSWTSFRHHFSANLTPTYLPTWCQNPPKVGPRAIQNPSKLPSCHRSCVLGLAECAKRLNKQKWCQDPCKNKSQINTPTCIDFGTNLAHFGKVLGSKLEPR